MTRRMRPHSIMDLLLVAVSAAVIFAGCVFEPAPEPTATPDIPATVSAAVAEALGTPVAQPAMPAAATVTTQPVKVRPGHCGRLCEGDDYWNNASLSDVQAELNRGADVSATDEYGWTPLHFAAIYRYVDIVSLLLEIGADANARDEIGWDPLLYVISDAHDAKSDPEIVAMLLDHGAEVNAVNMRDANKFTPLHWATVLHNPATHDIVRILLDNGADVKAKDNFGQMPLHYASQASNHNVISLLLDHGSPINAQSYENRTPLHAASWSDKPSNVRLLLSRGADTRSRNGYGQTPCEGAIERHDTCKVYYRSSDPNPDVMFMCLSDDINRAERAQKEIISLLCR